MPGVVSIEFCRPLGARLAIGRSHSVLLANPDGRVEGKRAGFFHHQTCFLSGLDFRVAGKKPAAASVSIVSSDRLVAYYLAHLPREKDRRDGSSARPAPVVEVEADWRVGDRLALTLRISNRSADAVQVPLSWRFAADFAGQGEAEAGRRQPLAAVESRWEPPAALLLQALHPDLRHASRISFRGPCQFAFEAGRVTTRLDLEAQAEAKVEIEAAPLFDARYAGELPTRGEGPSGEDWMADCARLEASDETVQTAWDRAAQDLKRLQLGDGVGEERFTPAGGFPHYIALFGRDALMTGWQSALLNPATLRGSLSLVGRWTAREVEPDRDAQPGRVLHQRQLGPMALLGKTPFLRYYGDHSASALFLTGVAHAFARSGDRARFLASRDLALRTLEWMDRFGDIDGDGLYEYRTTARGGLKNQGWKDSDEAILYPDGRITPDPIVICEIQALFFAAKVAMAAAFRAAGEARLADDLQAQADEIRRKFDETMWMEDEGFVALGLDPGKRQIRTLASNAGECLAYGVLDEARARRVADRLMQPDFFSGWGIRTLSARHPAYNPLGYHLGSVWPCFTALIGRGFARYGLIGHLHTLARSLFDATRLFDHGRLPELFGGHARDADHPHPGVYPNACSPQAWSAGAVVLLVDTLVGLRPAAPLGAAVLDPKLPEWLPEVTLRGVSLGEGRVDLRVRRQADGSTCCEQISNTSGLRLFGPGLADGPDNDVRSLVEALP